MCFNTVGSKEEVNLYLIEYLFQSSSRPPCVQFPKNKPEHRD